MKYLKEAVAAFIVDPDNTEASAFIANTIHCKELTIKYYGDDMSYRDRKELQESLTELKVLLATQKIAVETLS